MPGIKKRMNLPVRAVDVFRLLAVRKVAEDTAFVGKLNAEFDTFLHRVRQTQRLTDSKRGDYLSYSGCHKKDNSKSSVRQMSEEELCVS